MTTTAPARHRSVALLAVVALVTLVLPAVPAAAATDRSGAELVVESHLFEQINLARSAPGSFSQTDPAAPTLRWAEDVAEVSRGWSDAMAVAGVHYPNPNVATEVCCADMVSESVGTVLGPNYFTYEAAAEKIVQMLMASKPHRDRLLDPSFTQVGAGVRVDADAKVWVTVVYRDPDGSAPPGTTTYPHPLPSPAPTPGDDADTPPDSGSEPGDPDGSSEDPDAGDPDAGDPEETPDEGTGTTQPELLDILPACPASVPKARFTDVKRPEAVRAVSCLVWWGVTTGTSPTTFDPGTPVRRDQMASFIARAMESSGGSLPRPVASTFRDVPSGTTHADAVNKLAAAGIVDGEGGRYRPNDAISRGEMTETLVRAYAHRTGTARPDPRFQWFSDVTGSRHADTINHAADAGWAAGYPDGTFRADNGVRRDQMALFISRWLANLVTEGAAVLPH